MQGKSGEVEKLRLEVDSRRRTVADLAVRLDAARHRVEGASGDRKAQAQLEELTTKLHHKEEKLTGRGFPKDFRGRCRCPAWHGKPI